MTFPTRTLATVTSTGSAEQPAALPMALVSRADDLSGAKIAKTRKEVFGIGFTINGKHFKPGRIDATAHLGTVEQWTLVNTSYEQHPFHTHTDYFQVMSVNGTPYDANSLQDTVIIPVHVYDELRELEAEREFLEEALLIAQARQNGDDGTEWDLDEPSRTSTSGGTGSTRRRRATATRGRTCAPPSPRRR